MNKLIEEIAEKYSYALVGNRVVNKITLEAALTDLSELLAARSTGEPVAWRVKIGDSDMWGYDESESQADFHCKQSMQKYIKEPLYAHPLPSDSVAVPMEVLEFYRFAEIVFEPFTSQQEQLKLSLDKARKVMRAAKP